MPPHKRNEGEYHGEAHLHLPPRRCHSSRGFVFIVILAVLTILLLLGVVFVMMSELERSSASSYVDKVYARMLAHSGVETVITCLPEFEFTDQKLSPAVYGLEFADTNKNGRYDPDHEQVTIVNSELPLETCRFPSFKGYGNQPGDTSSEVLIKRGLKTETVGYSGSLPAPLVGYKHIYSLRVRDCAGMLYVNGPGVSADNWALAPNAKRMLNNLGAQFGISNMGDIISAARARQKQNFTNRDEIKTALLNAGYNDSDFRKIRDYLTCYAWVDSQTILPGAFIPINQNGAEQNPNRKWSVAPGQSVYGLRPMRGYYFLSSALKHIFATCPDDQAISNKRSPGGPSKPTPEPGTTPQPAQSGKTTLLQPRAPVNINTASAVVLQSVLEGVWGYYLDRSQRTGTAPGSYTKPVSVIVPAQIAREVADAIVVRRQERVFRAWSDFNGFIDGLAMLNDSQKMVIKANANPNSHLSKFNPDKSFGIRFGDTDKSDLGNWTPATGADTDCGWSTEFCFSSMGYYEVESLGQVLGPTDESGARRVFARSRASTVLKLYQVIRHTTQKDFEKNMTEQTGVTVYPESLPDLKGTDYWPTIQSRCIDKAETGCSHQLCYDGYVMLTPQDTPVLGEAGCILSAGFTDTLSAKSAGGNGQAYGLADEDRSLIDPNDPSELFNDGVFCHETRRSGYSRGQTIYGYDNASVDEFLRYKARGNFPLTGSMEMWFKPAWSSGEIISNDQSDTRMFFTMGYGENKDGLGDGEDDRVILIARSENSQPFVACHYAACVQGSYGRRPAPRRHGFPYLMTPAWNPLWAKYGVTRQPIGWSSGDWHHLALSWNPSAIRLFVDGRQALGSPLVPHRDAFPVGINDEWSIYLGNNRFESNLCNGYPLNADGTIDNFRVYTQEITASFIPTDRYQESAGFQGFTCVFRPEDFPALKNGGRLGTISWTGYQTTNRTGNLEFQVTTSVTTGGGTTVTVPDGTDGQGYDLNLAIDQNTLVSYRVRFMPSTPNNFGFIDQSPVLDDVTITIMGKPEFLVHSID